MNEQAAAVFAMLQCQKHLTQRLIQILPPTRATVSAVRRFIDELTLPLQRLRTKNIVGIFFFLLRQYNALCYNTAAM